MFQGQPSPLDGNHSELWAQHKASALLLTRIMDPVAVADNGSSHDDGVANPFGRARHEADPVLSTC